MIAATTDGKEYSDNITTIRMRKLIDPAMVTMAIVLSALLVNPVSGNGEGTASPLTLIQSVTARADAMEPDGASAQPASGAAEPAYMLEQAGTRVASNPCFETMMAMGCRIQSQIPIWNQFAAMFATTFGISCPAMGPGLGQ